MGLFILGVVAGYVAFVAGRWRGLCLFFTVQAPWNLPHVWHNPLFRFGSWVFVVVASLLFAMCWTKVFVESVHPSLARFSWLLWAVLLTARWLIAGTSAVKEGRRVLGALRPLPPDDGPRALD